MGSSPAPAGWLGSGSASAAAGTGVSNNADLTSVHAIDCLFTPCMPMLFESKRLWSSLSCILAISQMRDLVQEWGAAADSFEQAPPPGSEWAQTNTPSQQAASAGPLVCIICLNQAHILFLPTVQKLNLRRFSALLSHVLCLLQHARYVIVTLQWTRFISVRNCRARRAALRTSGGQ